MWWKNNDFLNVKTKHMLRLMCKKWAWSDERWSILWNKFHSHFLRFIQKNNAHRVRCIFCCVFFWNRKQNAHARCTSCIFFIFFLKTFIFCQLKNNLKTKKHYILSMDSYPSCDHGGSNLTQKIQPKTRINNFQDYTDFQAYKKQA